MKRLLILSRPSWCLCISPFVVAFLLIVWGCEKNPGQIVLAEVNGQKITLEHFDQEMSNTPEEMRIVYRNRAEEVLDRLVVTALLLQEAKKKGMVPTSDLSRSNETEVQSGIKRFLEQSARGEHVVTDEEIEAVYEQIRDRLGGRPLSEVRERIREMILAHKSQTVVSDLITRLRSNAAVRTYPERLPKPPPPAIEPSTASEFEEALKSGKPTVVDFGSSHCIPCIRLRPVLRRMKDAHGDRVHVMFLEINENQALARVHKVQLIPTVIFFDAGGKEVKRHMGFMDHTAMEEAFRQLGFVGG